jgi:hypothetical protein
MLSGFAAIRPRPAFGPSPAGTRPPPAACGFTLAELVVALGVAGTAFGAFALAVAQQERVHAELARRVRAHAQLREGLAALTADLRAASPAAGDIAASGARDSSLELRTTIGTAVVCDVAIGSVTGALASFVTPPKAGDTAWAYLASDSSAAWAPLPIAGVGTVSASRATACALPAAAASIVGVRQLRRSWYSLELSQPVRSDIPIGTPLRITRPARYSLYRSTDARWYLGRREWSPARGRFETIQPVSGPYPPYASEASESSGLELRYFDADAVQIPSGSPATDRIAQVTVLLRTPAPSGNARTQARRDVTSVTIALRNSP